MRKRTAKDCIIRVRKGYGLISAECRETGFMGHAYGDVITMPSAEIDEMKVLAIKDLNRIIAQLTG